MTENPITRDRAMSLVRHAMELARRRSGAITTQWSKHHAFAATFEDLVADGAEWDDDALRFVMVEPPLPAEPPRLSSPSLWVEIEYPEDGSRPRLSLSADIPERDEEDTLEVMQLLEDTIAREWDCWQEELLAAKKRRETHRTLRAALNDPEAEIVAGYGLISDGAGVDYPVILHDGTSIATSDGTVTIDFDATPTHEPFRFSALRAEGAFRHAPELIAQAEDPYSAFESLVAQIFNERDEPRPASPTSGQVRWDHAWVLMVREPTTPYLQFFESYLQQLEDGIEITPAFSKALGGNPEHEPTPLAPVLHPQPLNQEQSRVLDQALKEPLFAVQGPPGTGKTYTIANLICAAASAGQRVLVVSEKEQALAVLRDRLPRDLQRLCVSLTSNTDSSGLATAASDLAAASSQFDISDADDRLAALLEKHGELATERARLLAELDAAMSSLGQDIIISGKPYHWQDVLLWLEENRPPLRLPFTPDRPGLPYRIADLVSLVTLLEEHPIDDLDDAYALPTAPPILPIGSKMAAWWHRCLELDAEIQELSQQIAAWQPPPFVRPEPLWSPSQAPELSALVEPVEPQIPPLRLSGWEEPEPPEDPVIDNQLDDLEYLLESLVLPPVHGWATALLPALYSPSTREEWRARVEAAYISLADINLRTQNSVGVVVPGSLPPRATDLVRSLVELVDGGTSWRKARKRDDAGYLSQIRVDGRAVDARDLRRALEALEARDAGRELVARWNSSTGQTSPIAADSADVHTIVSQVDHLHGLIRWCDNALDPLTEALESVGLRRPRAPHEVIPSPTRLDTLRSARLADRRRVQRREHDDHVRQLRREHDERNHQISAAWAAERDRMLEEYRERLRAERAVHEQRNAEILQRHHNRVREEEANYQREHASWLVERNKATDRARQEDVTPLERRRAARQEERRVLEVELEKVREALRDLPERIAAPMQSMLETGEADEWDRLRLRLEHLMELRRLASGVHSTYSDLKRTHPELLAFISGHGCDILADLPLLWAWEYTSHLADQLPVEEVGELRSEVAEIDAAMEETKGQACELAAWRHAVDRLGSEERSALATWATAESRVPKTQSAKSYRRRQLASRVALESCRDAVPIWIAPLRRALSTFSTDKPFDLIVVDESSQSPLEAAAILALGERAVIVGDNKQHSPHTVVSDDYQQALLNKLPQGMPARDLLDFDFSLYDYAYTTGAPAIELREHHRCRPEIIAYSNRIAYAGPGGGGLIPTRPSPGSSELPAFRDECIASGLVELVGESDRVNPDEVERVVSLVREMLDDDAYENKTIGIISLLGQRQADQILRRLLEELSPADLENRKIRCGTSRAFQGDERDVMLLSMVVSTRSTTGEKLQIGAMTSPGSMRIMNVAVSRARDQVVIVRSIEPHQLSSVEDYRAVLIRQAANCTPVAQATLLELLARCRSEFERRVVSELHRDGYTLSVNLPALGYEIDIVVWGDKGRRLAVELDGERYHGLERLEADLIRQRALERAGWTFHRIRGRDYFKNPERAVNVLKNELSELGISSSPHGAWALTALD